MQDQEHTILSHPEEYQEPDACMLLCAEHRPYFGTRAIEAVLKRIGLSFEGCQSILYGSTSKVLDAFV
eukprot:1160258-Pelagomonas_calceolata.AAC.3